MKAVQKLSDLFCGERMDDAPRFFETETEGDRSMRPAIAERATRRIDTLEMGMASGDLLSGVESIQTANHCQAMVYSLRRGLRLLVLLMPDIVQQRGLGDLRNSLGPTLKPTSEVKQVIGVGAD